MNPAERRIIHLSLADDDEVVTESQGRGFFKRVSIRPAKMRPRGFDNYNR
jgi:predicted RNA-binding protein Jag